MLERFERLMQDTLEGGLRRVFSAQLQPIQLAKAAARAMEEAQVVGLRGVEVPNLYRLRVAPADLARFADFRATLGRELSTYLAEYARDRGLVPVSEPRAEVDADERVQPGSVRVETRFVDIEPERAATLEEALDQTRRLRLGDLSPRPVEEPTASAWLEDEAGARYPLEPLDGLVRIGRSLDNDVVLADPRVSRYHAHLRWDGRGWRIEDLQSTNGTQVNGQPVPPGRGVALGGGATVQVGGPLLRYRAEHRAGSGTSSGSA